MSIPPLVSAIVTAERLSKTGHCQIDSALILWPTCHTNPFHLHEECIHLNAIMVEYLVFPVSASCLPRALLLEHQMPPVLLETLPTPLTRILPPIPQKKSMTLRVLQHSRIILCVTLATSFLVDLSQRNMQKKILGFYFTRP